MATEFGSGSENESSSGAEVLANPFWHALAGPQSAHSHGNASARRYRPGLATQAALAAPGREGLTALAGIVEPGETVHLFWPERHPLTAEWSRVIDVELQQMLYQGAGAAATLEFVELGPADVPEMLALAEETRPGPFLPGGIELGRFVGVRQEGALVAMAGERANPKGYREISAVCTLPDYRGRGYARALVEELAQARRRQGETPFLHAELGKPAAIEIYRRWGFEPVRRLWVTVLRRTGEGL